MEDRSRRWSFFSRACLGAVLLVPAAAATGQSRVPLGDEVETPRLPTAVRDEDIHVSGTLAFLFKSPDGADVVHVIGESRIRIGDPDGEVLSSREAVLWISAVPGADPPHDRIEIYLRDDATMREPAGTIWTGPVLFATVATRGRVYVHHDYQASDSTEETRVYQEGAAVREALRGSAAADAGPVSSIQVFRPPTEKSADQTEIPSFVSYRSRSLSSDVVDGRRLVTAVGDVAIFRGKPGSDRFVEIRAEGAVIFLPLERDVGPDTTRPPAEVGDETGDADSGTIPMDALAVRPEGFAELGVGGTRVDGVYLEGDVVLTTVRNSIRASRLYYDFEHDRALILDAVVRVDLPERNVPLFIRAAEVRQLSARQLEATDAMITTSEFHAPHYHVGARKVELVDRTQTDFYGRRTVPRTGTFQLRDATLNIAGLPVLYWPVIRGEIDEGETSIRGVSVGYSRSFGAELQTEWRLFNVLGAEPPEGFDGTLKLDYFSDRGPAVGVDLDYRRDDSFGELRSYVIHDEGEDNLGTGRKNIEPENDLRGRFLMRHRQYLQDDWQLTFELSYISDRNFLEEYFEKEFDIEKEQESLIYLKKQVDHWAFTAHLQYRILDFTTQTERLPDFSFRLVGEPVAERLTWFSETRAGFVRYRAAETTLRDFLQFGRGHVDSSGTTARTETRQELDAPLDIGPMRIVPFVSGRAGAWDDTPELGGDGRVFGAYGVRGSMYFWRVDEEMRSAMWDVDGVRHIIKPDFVVWGSHTNLDSDGLYPFDEDVEGIDEVDGVSFGVRQRWQTRRGPPDARRTVDVVTWDVDVGAFNDAESDEFTYGFASFARPENSVSRNYVNHSLIWRINDATALVNDINYDMNDGEIDAYNVSLVVERTPRLTYLLAYRFIEETESNLIGFGANYELNEKYTLALREEFDLDRGKTLDLTVGLLRRYPRWDVILAFNVDEAEDDVGVSMSLVPQGFPGAAIGPRRFTGLVESMKIQNR